MNNEIKQAKRKLRLLSTFVNCLDYRDNNEPVIEWRGGLVGDLFEESERKFYIKYAMQVKDYVWHQHGGVIRFVSATNGRNR